MSEMLFGSREGGLLQAPPGAEQPDKTMADELLFSEALKQSAVSESAKSSGVSYDAVGAFQNALQAPPPQRPQGLDKFTETLAACPAAGVVNPVTHTKKGVQKATKQDTLSKTGKNGKGKKKKASFGKKGKHKLGHFVKKIAKKLPHLKGGAPAADAAAAAAGAPTAAAAAPPSDGDLDEPLRKLRKVMHELGLPEEALPTSLGRGSKSYTIHALSMAVVEVQHTNKKFYIKSVSGGGPLGAGSSPSITWSKFESVAAAWGQAKLRCESVEWTPVWPARPSS